MNFIVTIDLKALAPPLHDLTVNQDMNIDK